MSIYFDHAATSYPKAPNVGERMRDFIEAQGVNVGRGAYGKAYDEEMGLLNIRESIASLFGAKGSENVIFTSGVTQSLNTALRGLLEPGDNVLISPFEHNAVVRPLNAMAETGVDYSVLPVDSQGIVDLKRAVDFIKPNTKAVVLSHGSNVTGLIQPLEEIGRFAKERGLCFIVDSAQTAGLVDIDIVRDGIDALCFTGHKSLRGPQGTGGMVLADGIGERMRPFVYGGTGSFSDLDLMPEKLPDKFEAGTLNLPGIFGLGEAVKWVSGVDLRERLKNEQTLAREFERGISEIPGLKVVGGVSPENRTGVVSVVSDGRDISEIAFALDQNGVMIRSGLHCAPLAHKNLGTYPTGTLRFSFGDENSLEEVHEVLTILDGIMTNEKTN